MLYGQYPEFAEVYMTLKKLVEIGISEAVAKADSRSLSLAKGYAGPLRREIMVL